MIKALVVLLFVSFCLSGTTIFHSLTKDITVWLGQNNAGNSQLTAKNAAVIIVSNNPPGYNGQGTSLSIQLPSST
jgi:hypothetical protein